MPLLSEEQTAELLALAKIHRHCGECGRFAARDYCRTCDEFFWHHNPGCQMYERETEDHAGHRCVLIPFVENRGDGRDWGRWPGGTFNSTVDIK